MNILVTGVAGFIGFHYALNALKKDKEVNIIGIDNLNNYYDTKLKDLRLKILKKNHTKKFKFFKISINDTNKLNFIFKKFKINSVVHLAAQAGVRLSLKKPTLYIKNNIEGFNNILECCHKYKVKQLIYASSSSVYGENKKIPFSESDRVDNQISTYAVTKRANELLAQTYHKLYKVNSLGIRFFTVYGPYGRPDMFYFKASKKILNNEIIEIYNKGNHLRDFTYIDDAISALRIIQKNYINKKNYKEIYNIAKGKRIKLENFLKEIEKNLNLKAKIIYTKKQKGDVIVTSASIKKLRKLGYIPKNDIKNGIKKFIKWYLDFSRSEKKN